MAKAALKKGWLKNLSDGLMKGVIKGFTPVMENFDSRLSAIEVDPTELAQVEEHLGEGIQKGFQKFVKLLK